MGTRIHGKYGQVKIDTATILGVNNWSIDSKGAADDTTGMSDNGTKAFIPAQTEWSGSISGVWDSGNEDILPGVVGGTAPLVGANAVLALRLSVFDAPPDSTDEYFYLGDAVATSFKPEVSSDGVVKWTLDFQGTDDLTYPVTIVE